jgi:cobyric acid synthase CobQ/L-threonine-O-3-phosphate decarboxylase
MSGHGGNITEIAGKLNCTPADILDFSANINPLGPPSFLRKVINTHIPDLIHYPDPGCTALVKAIAAACDLEPEKIVVGNGTSELLFQLPQVLQPERAIIPVPSYIDYAWACTQAGVPVLPFLLKPDDSFMLDLGQLENTLNPGDMTIIGQPNNPTGQLVDRMQLVECIYRRPDVVFVIDEAFARFASAYESVAGIADNVVVLCSLTKIFAIPGLRLGFLAASHYICNRLRKKRAPWAVNTLAQVVGASCMTDTAYVQESQKLVTEQRHYLSKQIDNIPCLHSCPAEANFLLIRSDHPEHKGAEIIKILLDKHRIAVRGCANYHNLDDRYFRIAVRTRTENDLLLQALQESLQPSVIKKVQKKQAKKKPALMLLGTGSDVGKSVLVAALGRILIQDGIRVAPFKAQNMSLNSYVTRDGGEMGRAQVVQAQACRLDPDVRMNPILLKPSSDIGSQVIVNGQPVGNMKVLEYVNAKKELWQNVCHAYDSLSAEYDILLLEGAGSPGEVNLKSHDIVNTRMAAYAEARALLVGDIDRGGVYASFIGHFEVMESWERDLVAGFLVNRFRGDASLLNDAHEYMYNHTGKPVVGVIPYLINLGLPQEDSVSFKAGLFAGSKPEGHHVEIVVIDLPHISNFTDIEPFFEEPDVFLRIVDHKDQLGTPDAIILPGSKNVPADLSFIQESGLGEAVVAASMQGVAVVGICGGYQMLGRHVTDPYGLEGHAGEVCAGLGLLEMETALAADKILTCKSGQHLLSGCSVQGYEIHHGITRGGNQAILSFDDGSFCGQSAGDDKKIWGSYLHGIFDADRFRRWWINQLRMDKGLEPLVRGGAVYDLEPAFDRLAAEVREHIDMNFIYRLLDLN